MEVAGTKLEADVRRIREDKSLMRILIPLIVRGDVDWRWFNAFGEEVKRHNSSKAVQDKTAPHGYFRSTSGQIDIAFPLDVEMTPELVTEQEKLANMLAVTVDEMFRAIKEAAKKSQKEKADKIQEAMERIRNMKSP